MNEAEMFKLSETFDEDFCIADFANEKVKELNNSEFVQGIICNKKQQKKKTKPKNNNDKFKEQYFAFYDDIKIPSHKVTDW